MKTSNIIPVLLKLQNHKLLPLKSKHHLYSLKSSSNGMALIPLIILVDSYDTN